MTQSGPSDGKMGVFAAMSIIAGCMIGAGVFVTGSTVYRLVPAALVVFFLWIAGGIIAICGGLTWAEWALMIPKSGGDLPYLEFTYPRPRKFFGSIYVFSRVLVSNPLCTATLAAVCAQFAVKIFSESYFSALNQVKIETISKNEGDIKVYMIGLLAGWLFELIAFLLIAFSDVVIIRSSTFLTLLKMIIVVVLILIGICGVPKWDPESAWRTALVKPADVKTQKISISGLANGLLTVFFAYDGFANLSSVIGDMRNPRKDTLRAIIMGCASVSILYILVNALYMAVLSPQKMLDAGSGLAGIYIAKSVGLDEKSWISKFINVPIMVSAFGALSGISFSSARIMHTAASEHGGGFLPFSNFLGRLHPKFNTPFNCLVVHFGISFVILPVLMFNGLMNDMFSAAMYCNWVFYTITAFSLIYLRVKKPRVSRPFKVSLICPVIVVLFGVFMLVAPWLEILQQKVPVSAIVGVVTMIIAVVVYFIGSCRGKKNEEIIKGHGDM